MQKFSNDSHAQTQCFVKGKISSVEILAHWMAGKIIKSAAPLWIKGWFKANKSFNDEDKTKHTNIAC